LAIAAGCTAEPALLPDAGRDPVCGAMLGGSGPDLLLARVSRTLMTSYIGLQAVHASRAAPPATVELIDAGLGSALTSFGPLEFGQISPVEPPHFLTLGALSREPSGLGVRVSASDGSFPTTIFSLASVLSASGLDASRAWASGNMTFVLLGALPGLDAGPAGGAFRVAALLNAPASDAD
jgi:hypothetical protein